MISLLRELLKSGEISVSLTGLVAKGGVGILAVFILALILLWRL